MAASATSWAERLIETETQRAPDFVIRTASDPQMRRWYLIPKNRFFNVYLHHFLKSDEDRALHDHPWCNFSFLLRGAYTEHTILPGGIHVRTRRSQGDWKLRLRGGAAHRIELTDGPCWTLFITGPKYRGWGFHCPQQGWIPWERFCKPSSGGEVGKGCDG